MEWHLWITMLNATLNEIYHAQWEMFRDGLITSKERGENINDSENWYDRMIRDYER
jgi:hypothetical protein